jgi:hypothetical protein
MSGLVTANSSNGSATAGSQAGLATPLPPVTFVTLFIFQAAPAGRHR